LVLTLPCRLDVQPNQLLGSHGGFVRAFSKFFDHFFVEGWNVVGLATRNQSIINDDFLIDS
jgi:hypothetical protein